MAKVEYSHGQYAAFKISENFGLGSGRKQSFLASPVAAESEAHSSATIVGQEPQKPPASDGIYPEGGLCADSQELTDYLMPGVSSGRLYNDDRYYEDSVDAGKISRAWYARVVERAMDVFRKQS